MSNDENAMKLSARFTTLALTLLFALVPLAALANGVTPILNLFHRETWLPAAVVTVVIILTEAVLLRWRLRPLGFRAVLWRAGVINFASSAAASLILVAMMDGPFFLMASLTLLLPLFVITLAVEIPLLRRLFRPISLTWGRATALGLWINLASYAIVLLLEIGLFVGGISYAQHLDKRNVQQWQNPQLLGRANGVIYSTRSDKGEHGLRVFDPQTGLRSNLTNCPSLDPNIWDVRQQVCAFVPGNSGDWRQRALVIAQLPDFAVTREIGTSTFTDVHTNAAHAWQGVTDVAVSPDARLLAVLFRYSDAVAYKDQSSYFELGSKCRLMVLDIASGEVIDRASRWASDRGLCWLPDSQSVLFPSFDDERLYEVTKAEVKGGTSYGIGHAPDQRFARGIYAFHLDTRKVVRFADGHSPSLAVRSGRILVTDDKVLKLLDLSGQEVRRFEIDRIKPGKIVVSPDGTMVLAQLQRHSPFHWGSPLALIDLDSPPTRHLLDEWSAYRLVWPDTAK